MKSKCTTVTPGAPMRLALALTAAALVGACGGGGGDDGPPGPAMQAAQSSASAAALAATLATITPAALSADEASGLVFMREEEKLARDVYAALYARWGARVFANIAASEQAHMDAVKLLLTRYALPDPADGAPPGRFVNTVLQGLYDALVAGGQASLVAALQAGAEIEDLDIRDLRAIQASVDNADLLLVYANLERGSRNHLRAFHDNLASQGGSYTPKYITQAEYDAIVSTPKENR